MNRDPKKQTLKPHDILPFDWDCEYQDKTKPTKAELNEMFEKWDKVKFKKQT